MLDGQLGTWCWDFEQPSFTCSERLLQLISTDRATFSPPPDGYLGLIHPDDRAREKTKINAVLNDGAPYRSVVRLQKLNGDECYCRVEAAAVMDTNAKPTAIVGFMVDISTERQARRQLEDLHANLELAQRAAGFGIWTWDLEKHELYWDDRSCELHGMTREELPVRPEDWLKNMDPAERRKMADRFREAMETQAEYQGEYRIFLPGGGERIIQGNAVILRDPSGKPLKAVGTNIDLTETRRKEAALVEAKEIALRAQKAETIGNLTGGVAHDFNNLLAVIQGNLELLRDYIAQMTDDREPFDCVDSAMTATTRGAELAANMLAYARRAKLEPTSIDVTSLIQETENWMKRTIESNIEIESLLESDLPKVLADRSSLQNALVNLILNARDAMPKGGKLTISAESVPLDGLAFEPIRKNGNLTGYIAISVADSGEGIAPEKLENVFEPFYSTKPAGKGTGLGLSMVQGFVEQTGGTVTVHSDVGIGTTFKIVLPVYAEEIKRVSGDGSHSFGTSSRRSLRILLVEDDEAVMTTMTRMLEKVGHSVRQAANGDRALEIFRLSQRFDLLITDLMMPGTLQGYEVVEEIRKLKPAMPVIMISGYAYEAAEGDLQRASDISVLIKPVTQIELLRAIDQVTFGLGTSVPRAN